MTSLLDAVTQSVTPHMTNQFAEMLGMDDAQITQGIHMAAPVVLAGIRAKTSAPQGADEVLGSLKDVPHDPAAAVMSGQSDALLEQLFGMGVPKVAAWIENTTGIQIASILPLAAPLVMTALQSAVKEQSLDAAGFAALVKTENDAYAHANPQLASEINAALDAGENVNARAKRIRAQFTEDEWNTLARTPALAGYAVMMSSLSGPVGLSKEIAALIIAMQELGANADPDSLVGLVSRAYNSPEQITSLGAHRENATALARDACLEALRILTEKETYDESHAYKAFVVNVSERVAKAAIDGGIMSMGGKPVSADEQMTLDLIAAALAYQP